MSIEIPQKVIPGQPIVPEYDQDTLESGKILQARRYTPGFGTILRTVTISNGEKVSIISSTVMGYPEITKKNSTTTTNSKDLPVVEYEVKVNQRKIHQSSAKTPKEGDIVICRIVRLTPKQVNVEILSIDDEGLLLSEGGIGSGGPFNGSSDFISNAGSGSISSSNVLLSTLGATNAGLQVFGPELGETFKGIIRSQDIRATEKDKVKVVESFMPMDIVKAEVINIGDGTNYFLSTAKNELGVVLAKTHSGWGEIMYPLDYETMVGVKSGDLEKRKVAKPF